MPTAFSATPGLTRKTANVRIGSADAGIVGAAAGSSLDAARIPATGTGLIMVSDTVGVSSRRKCTRRTAGWA